MPGKAKHLGVPNGRMVVAVSDGELNSAGAAAGAAGVAEEEGRGSTLSIQSLPSAPSRPFAADQSVASWAQSFERLLQDRLGLAYFTEFLKKEFSAENVSFWQACERFQQIPASDTQQLAQEARSIYEEFLSSQALSPVNIDRQAWLGEEVLAAPSPGMFRLQQLQIFNLMKFDSYARFVKSPLYHQCLLAESEGRPLGDPGAPSPGSPNTTFRKKPKLKPGKSLPLGVEELGQLPTGDAPGARMARKSFRRGDLKEAWTEQGSLNGNPALRRESQGSLNSSASLDLGFLAFVSGKPEGLGHRKSLGSSEGEGEGRPGRYCCVYLPDGTASLASVRPDLSIRAMLTGICEKRGLSLPDVKVYLMGNEQKALVLDQESMVLADKQVKLENRISFDLEISALGKTVRISSKPAKRLREVLQPFLGKYQLSLQQVKLHLEGEKRALDLEKPVTSVASQRVILDTIPGVKVTAAAVEDFSFQTKAQGGASRPEEQPASLSSLLTNSLAEGPRGLAGKRRTCDIEGLVELLNRVQSCRANDQRGLLRKEDLVLPDFLQLPSLGREEPPTAPAHPPSPPCPAQTEPQAPPPGTSMDAAASQATGTAPIQGDSSAL
ncbi:regulator of G-protein signaling 14 [Ornithorhynchus anatinus]|uniref:regulator of G-protein signaling 14 n=1 Tax=Ornithorhynchus anatinus TaxID=9258 RepID=UPI0010A789A5|nr:regulator of G-protein signaling 14 [Ornithorhynchus anatinus]